jgi:predicted nucleic-acid-binding protein
MKEDEYTRGYYDGIDQGLRNGRRQERELVLEFIEAHEGISITVKDIANEITARYRKEQEEQIRGMKL